MSIQRIDNVFWIQLVQCHHLRVHPYTHAINIAHQLNIANTGDALQAWLHVDIEIVGDEGIVIAIVGTLQGDDAQHALFFLLHLHTNVQHLGGQIAFSLLYTVLDTDLCQVGVGARSEGNTDGSHATTG